MSYLLIGACLCLVGLALADLAATAWAAGFLAVFGRPLRQWEPSQRRRLLAAARVLPFSMAALFTASVLVPAYVRFEPRDTAEAVGPILGLAALLALALLLWAPWRAFRAWRVTRRLEASWLRSGQRMEIPQVGLVVWRVPEGGGGLWVSGLLRPRLILGGAVLETLTPAELGAAMRHELAHVAGRDNLVRLALAACPGALPITSLGRRLDREWARAAEVVADRRAVGASPGAAVELASALIKVARLGGGPGLPRATSALGDGPIEERVRALLADPRPVPITRLSRVATWSGLLLPLAGILAFSLAPRVLALLHTAGESLVRAL